MRAPRRRYPTCVWWRSAARTKVHPGPRRSPWCGGLHRPHRLPATPTDGEIVAIGTPSGVHADDAEAAVAAGLHVLCEKPLDVTTARIDWLLAAVDHAGVTLGVFFQDRCTPDLLAIKDAVTAGRLGRPILADARVKWYRPPEYLRQLAVARDVGARRRRGRHEPRHPHGRPAALAAWRRPPRLRQDARGAAPDSRWRTRRSRCSSSPAEPWRRSRPRRPHGRATTAASRSVGRSARCSSSRRRS